MNQYNTINALTHLDTIQNKMAAYICQIQNVLRYIYYLDNEPLDINKEDVKEKTIEEQIHTIPFNPDLLTENKVQLFIHIYDGSLEKVPLAQYNFNIDIIVPTKYWKMNNNTKTRGIQIAYEVLKEIEQKNFGLGKNKGKRFRIATIDNKFIIFHLAVFVDSSNSY